MKTIKILFALTVLLTSAITDSASASTLMICKSDSSAYPAVTASGGVAPYFYTLYELNGIDTTVAIQSFTLPFVFWNAPYISEGLPLYIWDSNGDSVIITNSNQISVCLIQPATCLVTVDSLHEHNIVVWDQTAIDSNSDSVLVYREIANNVFSKIGSVSKDSLSMFKDTIADPLSHGWKYVIKSKNNSTISVSSKFHNTLHITYIGFGNFILSQYIVEGDAFAVAGYNIYRDDISTGNFQQIDFMSGSQNAFADGDFDVYPNASYYVEAVMTSGSCNPSREAITGAKSNISHILNTTGIEQLNNSSIKIYNNNSNIFVKGVTKKSKVIIYNLLGELVFSKEISSDIILDENQFNNGVYFVNIQNKTTKIIISR